MDHVSRHRAGLTKTRRRPLIHDCNRFFRWHRLEITADKSRLVAFSVLAADIDAVYFRTQIRAPGRQDVCAAAYSGFEIISRWTNEGSHVHPRLALPHCTCRVLELHSGRRALLRHSIHVEHSAAQTRRV